MRRNSLLAAIALAVIVVAQALLVGTAQAAAQEPGISSSSASSTDSLLQPPPVPYFFIAVPPQYVYDESLGALNDYCTSVPESFGPADFRGPCALHDLCYAGNESKSSCDSKFRIDLNVNCRWAHRDVQPAQDVCQNRASQYYAGVVAFGGG